MVNQTDNPISENKWREKRMKTKTQPLILRMDKAIKQAKKGLKSRGFNLDLASAIMRRNILEKKFRQRGLTIAETLELADLKKDIPLATTLNEIGQY